MSEEEACHRIFTRDPDEWMQYVYKKVSVLMDDGQEQVGLVYTVDPVSETFVLVNLDGNSLKLELVMSHAVSTVTVLSEDIETHKLKLDRLFLQQVGDELSEEEVKQRQATVRAWLLKNRLPVQVGGVNGELLSIADALVIQPPYGAQNCVSTNEIILGKIQGLIQNMPADQTQW